MKCTKEYRMSFDQKARGIVSQMTFEEKVHMMAGHEALKASMGGGDYNSHPLRVRRLRTAWRSGAEVLRRTARHCFRAFHLFSCVHVLRRYLQHRSGA